MAAIPPGAAFPRGQTASRTLLIPKNDVGTPPLPPDPQSQYVRLLQPNSAGGVSWPCCVVLAEENQHPFDVLLLWTSGGGQRRTLVATAMGGSIRIFVHAQAMVIEASAWGARPCTVNCTVTNTPSIQHNQLVRVSQASANLVVGPVDRHDVPPFAKQWQYFGDTLAAVNGALFRSMVEQAGAPVVIGEWTGLSNTPLDVGQAQEIQVTAPAVVVNQYSIVYHLEF